MRTIVEDLNYANAEPSNVAADQAKQLGLTYVGFGRYEDPKTRQVTHIVQNDSLVPYKKAIKTNTYRQTSSDDIGNLYNTLSPDVEDLINGLSAAQPVTIYDESEINAIQYFISGGYVEINDRLSTLPAAIPAKNIQPNDPNDDMSDVIAALDSAIKKSRAPEEYVVYIAVEPESTDGIQPGTSFRFKSFRNASVNLQSVIDPEENETFILQVRLKKNARGLFTGELSETPEEAEVLLPRGAKIEVLSGPTKLVGSDSESAGYKRTIYYYDCVTKS
jgi:hypothetical protein